MTREHLLEAMGLLDDDLIQEAEKPVRRKKRNPEVWVSLAACLAVVLTIGYGLTHIGMGSGNTASGAASQETTEDWSGATGGSGSAAIEDPGDASPNTSDEVLLVIVPVGDKRYAYFHYYEEDRVLETLPEGCRSLGEVGQYTEGEDIPYTDMNVFPGCPLWIAGDGWDGPVYLETPEGVYLECILG